MLLFFPSVPPPLPAKPLSATPSPRRLIITAAAPAAASSSAEAALAKSALRRITEKLRNLGYIDSTAADSAAENTPSAAGEIFVPTPHEIPAHRVGSTLEGLDSSWSSPEHPVPVPGAESGTVARFSNLYRSEKAAKLRAAQEREREGRDGAAVPTAAELMLPIVELRRLRTLGIRLDKKLKVGKAGVTEGIVNAIHERWRNVEVVKIRCEDMCKMNMKHTHEILERKTGGLVVWRSGSTIILYRGANYQYPYFHISGKGEEQKHDTDLESLEQIKDTALNDEHAVALIEASSDSPSRSSERATPVLVSGVGSPSKVRFQLPGEAKLAEEADKLLEGLGPRFNDWWGYDPQPVDADLLPAIVPGFRKPFRLLPYGIRPYLTDREMTSLRRLGRPVPCHFALGRNRGLQGLAVAVIKLWERCEIAKIAVKRGVQNTRSELMAEELKNLTGGTLLSRDKDYIVFYRGKDFLPPAVSVAIEKRRSSANMTMDKPQIGYEEKAVHAKGYSGMVFAAGTSATEPRDDITTLSTEKKSELSLQRAKARLNQAIAKKERAENLLAELEKTAEPPKSELDKEAISKEERYMLRKVGLRMKPFLLLGRRGVFDGTVENMHLHWKYRELVKIICKEHRIAEVEATARVLEAESGGILVAVERTSKGYAIIIYRGKNYRRPSNLRPKSLLNKREAMNRSLEAQRRQSLKLHVLSLTKNIDKMKTQMASNCETATMDTYDLNGSVTEEVPEFPQLDGNNSTGIGESINNEATINVGTSGLESDNPTQDKFIPEMGKNDSEADLSSSAVFDNITSESSCAGFGVNDDLEEKEQPQFPEADNSEGSFSEIPFKAAPLSTRERLLLRKQALKMKKRPVLAVGRNNVIAGVARTIKTHFRKHPLAIVNIKARAEGTCVQKLISELEEATGSVHVSTEPNKVILYRAREVGESGTGTSGKGKHKNAEHEVVSPELLEAIRVECGLQQQQQEQEGE